MNIKKKGNQSYPLLVDGRWQKLFEKAKKLSKDAEKLSLIADDYYKRSSKLYIASSKIYRRMDKLEKTRMENDTKYPKVAWGHSAQVENQELEKKSRHKEKK